MTLNNTIDWLTYRSYESNRAKAPHIPYYKWRSLYEDALKFEEIYEQNIQRIYTEYMVAVYAPDKLIIKQ